MSERVEGSSCSSSSLLLVGFEDKLWQVPVTIATPKNQAAYRFVLDQRSTTITLEGLQPNDWIKVHKYYNLNRNI